MSGMAKAKARQSNKHKVYFQRQPDKTVVNKLITWARHIVRFNDTRSLDRLKQQNPANKARAAKIAESPKIKSLLANN